MKKILVNDGNCTMKMGTKEFTSGGAFIGSTNKMDFRGWVYIQQLAGKWYATHWDSAIIAHLDTHTPYRGNFCGMVRISFTLDGIKFVGDYCDEWSQSCRVRSTKQYVNLS
jgi:hypothetical protein